MGEKSMAYSRDRLEDLGLDLPKIVAGLVAVPLLTFGCIIIDEDHHDDGDWDDDSSRTSVYTRVEINGPVRVKLDGRGSSFEARSTAGGPSSDGTGGRLIRYSGDTIVVDGSAYSGATPPEVELTMPDVEYVRADRGADIQARSMDRSFLDVVLEDDTRLRVLSGEVGQLGVTAAGGSRFEGARLDVGSVVVDASGESTVEVCAEQLTDHSADSSTITLRCE
jgi:hypothetical protein